MICVSQFLAFSPSFLALFAQSLFFSRTAQFAESPPPFHPAWPYCVKGNPFIFALFPPLSLTSLALFKPLSFLPSPVSLPSGVYLRLFSSNTPPWVGVLQSRPCFAPFCQSFPLSLNLVIRAPCPPPQFHLDPPAPSITIHLRSSLPFSPPFSHLHFNHKPPPLLPYLFYFPLFPFFPPQMSPPLGPTPP